MKIALNFEGIKSQCLQKNSTNHLPFLFTSHTELNYFLPRQCCFDFSDGKNEKFFHFKKKALGCCN
jgi:hypothetical protein